MLGNELEILDHSFHGRIISTPLLQLQAQAFRYRARHDARRIKALAYTQYGLDIRDVSAERRGDFLQIGAQISRIVGFVDQAGRDQSVGR